MNVVDSYTLRPDEVSTGQVMIATVTIHLDYPTRDGKPTYRVYKCRYGGQESGGIPQGSKLLPEQAKAVAEALFPVVTYAELVPSP
jgi:hypothetical protein